MSFFLIALFLLFFLLYLILHLKKTSIIRKIQTLSKCEKLSLLNTLIAPAGFFYDPEEDIFSSTLDAWQRDFGYTALYDEAAPFTQIVFDCLPVYFDYQGKTWLVELWKGQYGINTGAEIGIYQADTVIPYDKYHSTLFHSLPDEELPMMQLKLCKDGETLFRTTERHWWLTGFRMGTFSRPEELTLKGSVTFFSEEMAESFLDALETQGYCRCGMDICGRTVTIPLTPCTKTATPCSRHPLRCRISQWKNKQFVRIYNYFTSPFEYTLDKLLYLWYFLPSAFRRAIQPRKKKCYRKYRRFRASDCHKIAQRIS